MKKTYKINLPKGMAIKPGSVDYYYDNDSLDISVELEKEKYKPKDGDFVYYEAGLIGIFKEFVIRIIRIMLRLLVIHYFLVNVLGLMTNYVLPQKERRRY